VLTWTRERDRVAVLLCEWSEGAVELVATSWAWSMRQRRNSVFGSMCSRGPGWSGSESGMVTAVTAICHGEDGGRGVDGAR
jgi:hypothetical protein